MVEDQSPVDFVTEFMPNDVSGCLIVTQPKVLFVEGKAFLAVMRLPNIYPTTFNEKNRKRVEIQGKCLEFHDTVLSARFSARSTPLPRGCRLLFFSLFAIGPFLAAMAMRAGYDILQFDPPRNFGTIDEEVRYEIEKELEHNDPFALIIGYGEGITDPAIATWITEKVKDRLHRDRVAVVETRWNYTEEASVATDAQTEALVVEGFEYIAGGRSTYEDGEEVTAWGTSSERVKDALQMIFPPGETNSSDVAESWSQPFCDIFY